MPKHGKNYRRVATMVDRDRAYAPAEAIALAKEARFAKFDETVEVHIRTGLDPRHADQQIRATTQLPHGLGKTVRVLVFAEGEAAREAEAAGADIVGSDELINRIQNEGFTDFDVAIAQRELMGKVGRLGRVLGPRGLMPNPRSGTVVDADAIARAVELCPTGALRYARLDGAPGERPKRPTFVIPIDDGPLVVMGDLHVRTPEGETVAREYRLTLCRCGKSENQPFCDNSHLQHGFRSASYATRRAVTDREDAPGEDAGSGPTIITPTRDGPLVVEGRTLVVTQAGELLAEDERLRLCRCGQSATKPFCDSSHEGRFESRAPGLRAERRRAETPAAFQPNPEVHPGRVA